MNDDLGRRKKALEGLLDEARKLVGNSVKRSFEVLDSERFGSRLLSMESGPITRTRRSVIVFKFGLHELLR